MLQCCAGICSWGQEAKAPEKPELKAVIKPVIRLDEKELQASTDEALAVALGLVPAPPGAEKPIAFVSADFQKNPVRLLVVVPSRGGSVGTWDSSLPSCLGSMASLLLWAEANSYSVAFFSGEDLAASPAESWDRILRGSPARYASVLVAGGMLPVLCSALAPVHPLLLSRFRTLCVCRRDAESGSDASQTLPPEQRQSLTSAMVVLPAAWEQLSAQAAFLHLFELFRAREERWSQAEVKKYSGFQGLKENDMPGLKRMPIDARIQRLDRDRANDELAQLLQKHERQDDSDQEPGVD